MKDVIKLRGCLEIALHNAYNNEEIQRVKITNTVVTMGRRWVLENIMSGTHAATGQTIGYIAIGTGTTAPTTANTALEAETTRVAINSFDTSNLTSNPPSWQAIASFGTNEANTTLAEAGLFNSASGGTMLARATFTTINKTTSNTLSISYTISN